MGDVQATLLRDLQRIEDEGYALRDGERMADVVALMLDHIGDPMPELRDELIYPAFHAWITGGRFTSDELRNLLRVLLSETHLFHGIGHTADQTVFTRSFTTLVIALVVGRHREQPFLTADDFTQLREALLRYYRTERDLRGLLDEGGWAHAASHGADALVELVQCPEGDHELQREVLTAIAGMLHNGQLIFAEEDDERIGSVVDTILVHDLLPAPEVAAWLTALAECASWPRSRTQVIARVNSKNLVRSLYFRRDPAERPAEVREALVAAAYALNRFAAR